MIIITGPTGVGKTDLSLKLAAAYQRAAIINADLGQCYTPLTIGTAKPDWRNETVPHYLFDILDHPVNFTAFQYRQAVSNLLAELAKNDQATTPIVVGGSGFYLQALLFQSPLDQILPHASDNTLQDYVLAPKVPLLQASMSLAVPPPALTPARTAAMATQITLWQQLAQIDPIRAQAIAPNDHYRLQRALEIWQQHGLLPSQCQLAFAPVTPLDVQQKQNMQPKKIKLIIVTRDTPELYARIDQRVLEMFQQGWLAEVQTLRHTAWAAFLMQKRLIGYDNVLNYLMGLDLTPNNHSLKDLPESVVDNIQKRSRNYAKRQMTFFRMLARKLAILASEQVAVEWLNLTATDVDLYIKRLLTDSNSY